jgi:hypothetical protein
MLFNTTKEKARSKQEAIDSKLNTICPYYTMFPVDFPLRVLNSAEKGQWVLDPFCGRGTTNFAARFLGLPTIGIDSNPVAVAIAQAKVVRPKVSEVIDLARSILEIGTKKEVTLPSGVFWRQCFHQKTLREICIIREALLKQENLVDKNAIALRALMLGILHGPLRKTQPSYLSNQMPRTYGTKPNSAVNYWRRNKLKPPRVKTLDLIERKANLIFKNLPPTVSGDVFLGDSRNVHAIVKKKKVSWVITSPPYLGMKSYVADQWIRNWFVGGQIGYSSKDRFVQELALVWKSVSKVCLPGASLVVRFGAIPSYNHDPSDVLKKSLVQSGAPWRVVTIKKAGLPTAGHRQAQQFKTKAGSAIEEIDLYAVLEA